MLAAHKATKIELAKFNTVPMRAFHMTWLAFFLCFFGWFGVAPLMVLVRDDLQLTKAQIGNAIIASVAVTIFARLLIGWMCDKYGPRIIYTWLLIVGAVPVMGIGLAWDYTSFLLFRLAIGVVGASFVVTQFHTSQMFAPNKVGTANATTAGWGNLGGGVTQLAMPLVVSALLALGVSQSSSWRIAMILPGVLLVAVGIAYYRLTQDTPLGNFSDPAVAALRRQAAGAQRGSFMAAARDPRVWALAVAYGACFGVELTINNTAALYFRDRFGLGIAAAGMLAALHGLLNIFARSLGGVLGDRVGIRYGLRARATLLGLLLVLEGVALAAFAKAAGLGGAVVLLVVFSLFVEMACGATFSVVPFINRSALGSVSGIVGAGGNLGAVLAGLLFRSEQISTAEAFFYLGLAVTCCAGPAFLVRFSAADERRAREESEPTLVRPMVVPAE
jgi:NNP family nitrate/nitrite transporter-like MFS transporter